MHELLNHRCHRYPLRSQRIATNHHKTEGNQGEDYLALARRQSDESREIAVIFHSKSKLSALTPQFRQQSRVA
ncbi:hypothetical protein DPMN_089439 [Dreissena polymorpha]|uniref:Uncharacterized protein n=1 Tax=Dreissena polymorpha TaxID=45954 RepID=A0A9D4QXE9_DREPO|nr:hypothetical protein DPMN_089439 [Dreissena polymorpha]